MSKKKFNIRKQLFNWHMWAGIFFGLPIVVVSVMAIFIAHEKELGTKNIFVNAGWLPGYQSSLDDYTYYFNDVKAYYQDSNITLYGTKLGLIKQTGDHYSVVVGTEGMEVRDILKTEAFFLIASKYGLLTYKNEAIIKVYQGDFHGLSNVDGHLIALMGKKGIISSNDDGLSWTKPALLTDEIGAFQMDSILAILSESPQMEQLSLEKMILDIHTGKAFFGEGSMWIWIDLISLSLLLMSITGTIMWWKRKYGKKGKAKSFKTLVPLNL